MELKKSKTFEGIVRIAKDKEWKLQRLKELGMCLEHEESATMDMHINYVGAHGKRKCMQELEKPR